MIISVISTMMFFLIFLGIQKYQNIQISDHNKQLQETLEYTQSENLRLRSSLDNSENLAYLKTMQFREITEIKEYYYSQEIKSLKHQLSEEKNRNKAKK